MIWQLIRRNPAALLVPVFTVIWAVAWWFVRGTAIGPVVYGALFGWTLGMGIIGPARRERYTPLELTLPIEGRQLFLSRVALLLALVWLPPLSAVIVPLAVRDSHVWADSLRIFEGSAVVTVTLLLVQCIRVEMIHLPAWAVVPVFAVTPLFPLIGFFPGSGTVAAVELGGCALASVVLFLLAWAKVPRSFQLAPVHLQDRKVGPARPERLGGARSKSPWWPVLRALYFGSWLTRMLLFWLVFAQVGVIAFGGWAPSAIFWIPALFAGYLRGLRWLIHLPVSANRLCWMVWFPITGAIVLGLLLNAAIAGFGYANSPEVTLGPKRSWELSPETDGSGTSNVQVPGGYWKQARGGTAPPIEAPWGESYRPETATWLGVPFYNPYSVGRKNSQRFLEWQFLRATQAVYGEAIPVSRIDDLGRMKTILHQPKAQFILPVILLLYFLVQVCALHLAGWKRLRNVHIAVRLLLAVAPVTLAFPFSAMVFPGPRTLNLWFDSLVLQLTASLPDNLWTLTAMALIPMAGLSWLALKLWGEMEFGQIEGLGRQFREPGVGSFQSAWTFGKEIS